MHNATLYTKVFSLLLALLLLFTIAGAEETTTAATVTDVPLPELRLVQFDVGFANAYMLVLGEDVFLIDCGNAAQNKQNEELMMNYLEGAGIKRITAHFVTHFHDDHCGNMNPINEAYADENTIIYTPYDTIPARFEPLKNGSVVALHDNDELHYGDMTIKCVGPMEVKYRGTVNKESLNLLITYGTRRILLTGDFVDTGTVLYHHAEELANVDVMQFPHHGLDPYTIRESALALINPTYVLVPGSSAHKLKDFFFKNHYRREMNPTLYSNTDGTFMITTDGTSLEFHTHLSPEDYRVTQSEKDEPAGEPV